MNVGILGTAGAISSHQRGNTSIAVAGGGSLLLVDCSGNPWQALAGVMPSRAPTLEHVLLTHRHTDHICGLPSLVHQLHLASRATGRPPLSVWGPRSALQCARRLLAAVGLEQPGEGFEVRFHPLDTTRETELSLGALQITAIPVCHGDVPTLGIRAAAGERPEAALIFSADTSPCEALLHYCDGARLLIHECSSFDRPSLPGHTTLDQLHDLLARTAVPDVRLVHLDSPGEPEEESVRRRLAERYGERVRLAEDGELLAVR